jgi:hypothetical protein
MKQLHFYCIVNELLLFLLSPLMKLKLVPRNGNAETIADPKYGQAIKLYLS